MKKLVLEHDDALPYIYFMELTTVNSPVRKIMESKSILLGVNIGSSLVDRLLTVCASFTKSCRLLFRHHLGQRKVKIVIPFYNLLMDALNRRIKEIDNREVLEQESYNLFHLIEVPYIQQKYFLKTIATSLPVTRFNHQNISNN